MILSTFYEVISLLKTILFNKEKACLMESNGGMHVNLVNTYSLKRTDHFGGKIHHKQINKYKLSSYP